MDESFPLSFSESDKGKTLPLTCKEMYRYIILRVDKKFNHVTSFPLVHFIYTKTSSSIRNFFFSLSSPISDITVSHCSVNMNYKLLKAVVVYNYTHNKNKHHEECLLYLCYRYYKHVHKMLIKRITVGKKRAGLRSKPGPRSLTLRYKGHPAKTDTKKLNGHQKQLKSFTKLNQPE